MQGPQAWDLVRTFIDESRDPPAARGLALAMLDRANLDRKEADRLLAQHARHWDVARLALVDRNILRQAVSELLAGEVPPRVVITEALHLAREFSTAESPRFINGVLDAIAKQLRPKEE